ncbi:D-Ala-D-Ala carboxypeptidase family metallohydrolase [Cupriavidus metallidurans]|uniref:D-Ala-D-Ala carboxypeptidase family metallohydrolase n=1 Tax=Cupriavidus metallidurans TaxID=119219 RepID=UPI001CCB4BC2|nr:D-Ala-D-Ala carboxypeptidase family metallohydrolase [Cupriavidus metallidurans]UBM12744.1 peptidase M15 [Cupriavidus metallidurans]
MNLSPHFTLEEMTASNEAARRRLDNSPSVAQVANLRRVAQILEAIRTQTQRPVVVSSGYRSPEVNKAVGGSATSAHMQGLAADINCYPYSPFDLGRLIVKAGIEFDQLIQEGTWLHVGLAAAGVKPRQELLTAVFTKDLLGRTKTTYKAGWFPK